MVTPREILEGARLGHLVPALDRELALRHLHASQMAAVARMLAEVQAAYDAEGPQAARTVH